MKVHSVEFVAADKADVAYIVGALAEFCEGIEGLWMLGADSREATEAEVLVVSLMQAANGDLIDITPEDC